MIHALINKNDNDYMRAVRREIHRNPETGFDLEVTASIVKRELNNLKIPFSEEYAKCGVVGFLNWETKGLVVALRADMDALAIEEKTGVDYASIVSGKMHACGHDTHTAILLGVARVLKRVEQKLPCRVMLIFQPAEETNPEGSGAAVMVANGLLHEVDKIIALHVDSSIPAGFLGIRSGEYMASSHPYTIEFFGEESHVAKLHLGRDALAMAVRAYQDITIMNSCEIDPLINRVVSVSSIVSGKASNIVASHAKMLIAVRTFNVEVDTFIRNRIYKIVENVAAEMRGSFTIKDELRSKPVINDLPLCEELENTMTKVVGYEKIIKIPKTMVSEDFSNYQQKVPGVLFRLGTRNEKLNCIYPEHSSKFLVDENILAIGCTILAQFILDQNQQSIH